ncbi:hypothetical protein [Escherichia coli]|uniref:hypothetical protein n=1 Tax=Escherichia coli TaxID=562 RepID=UPI0024026532|nr:hypothetical protein [Escherichia coli]MDF8461812.1 hypothetical protein [Escherichia coli]
MTKRRKKYQEKEEIRHPDSPEGLVVAAANNRAFAERLVGVQTSQSRSETWASLS